MIQLKNGHTFKYVVASGAWGFDGRDAGHGLAKLSKLPYRWLGLMDPTPFTIITKSLTHKPLRGNLRWWAPWRCIRPLDHGKSWINAVGLTNPGLSEWVRRHYPITLNHNLNIILSLAPANVQEARAMLPYLDDLDIKGIELNLRCPNISTTHIPGLHLVEHYRDVVWEFVTHVRHPIILKLSSTDPIEEVINQLAGTVDAFDLINAVPWNHLTHHPSPLSRYKLVGAVSGQRIITHALQALRRAKSQRKRTPLISGGGIYTFEEAEERIKLGADAISFGTIFLSHPTAPNQWVKKLESTSTVGVKTYTTGR
jgi:dihydroorotate dehydrogenase